MIETNVNNTKGVIMRFNCIPEQVSKLFLALFFIVVGMGTAAIGATSLPITGLLVALTLFGLAFYCFRDYLVKSCKISR